MSQQLTDLFQNFLDMSDQEKLEKVRQIRHTRTIERPKAAIRRRRKEATKSVKAKGAAEKLLDKMSDEEKAALLKKLTASEGE